MLKYIVLEIEFYIDWDLVVRLCVEILFIYFGFYVGFWYCFVYSFYNRCWYFMVWFVLSLSCWLIGIEIYFGVKIGVWLFIDYGFGVVIGEIVEFGDDVIFY